MGTYTWAWIMWILMFGVIEGVAIARHDWSGTLTNHVKSLFKVESPGHAGRKIGLGVFLAWLLGHMMGWI